MHYQPVADQIVRANPLDPLAAIIFVTLLAVAALLTARRPAFGLCVLIGSVPFALYRDFLGTTITLPKIALLGVLLGLTVHRDHLPSLRTTPIRIFLIAITCLLGATALSVLRIGSHEAALRETLKVAEYGLAFLAAYVCFKLDPADDLLRLAITTVVSAVALGALSQEFGDAPSGMYFNNVIIPRIAGALEGPNQLAGYLEIGTALLASFVCARPRWEFSVALGLAALADILTYSRSGLIGGAVAIAVVAVVYRRDATRLIAPLVTAMVAGASTTAGWAANAHTGGLGLFPVMLGVRTHANSLYQQALAEGGIPLIAATLFVVWLSIASFVKRAAESPFVAAALAASIALALHQTVDYVVFYPKVGEMWWIILALGAACV